MWFQVNTKKGIVKRQLNLLKVETGKYQVFVDQTSEIGIVWKAEGRVKDVKRGLVVGTKTVDRWFAETIGGEKLGRSFPYDEGFDSRYEALTELIEKSLKIKRDWK